MKIAKTIDSDWDNFIEVLSKTHPRYKAMPLFADDKSARPHP